MTSYVLGAVIHQVRSEGLPSSDPAVLDGRFPTVMALSSIDVDHDRVFRTGLDALLAGLTAPRVQHGER